MICLPPFVLTRTLDLKQVSKRVDLLSCRLVYQRKDHAVALSTNITDKVVDTLFQRSRIPDGIPNL
ncbi:hypothetical protein BDR03DRAFT_950860, partial [Suillus americanus]